MTSTFFNMLAKNHGIQLNKQQQAAVLHKDGPCLILAVPGGGKTTTLLSRTAYLILEQQIKPGEILSITFSRMSANDMKQRFDRIFGERMKQQFGDEKVSFATIHSFSYRVVMNYSRQYGGQLKMIEGGNGGKWAKSVMLKQLYQELNNSFISDSDYEMLVNDISYVKNMMLDRSGFQAYKSQVDGFHELYEAYENIKRKHDCIDFDDMLVRCYEILLGNTEVLGAYQKRYRYVQVDEAQDTSKLQHEIVRLLVGDRQNLFYVADDDQSIYGFRAACPSYLLNMKLHYPGATIYRMEQNYRSTGAIVNLTNRFIKANTERYDKNVFTRNDEGCQVTFMKAEQRFLQIKTAIEDIRQADYKEVAILYRNNHTAVSVAKQLLDHQIPFYLREFKNRFFTHWVVVDLLAILKFAEDPMDLSAFSKFYYRLKGYYISKNMLDHCKPGKGPVAERMQYIDGLNDHQRKNLKRLNLHFNILSTKKPEAGINYILDIMGYREFLMDRASTSDATYDSYLDMAIVLRHLAAGSRDYYDLMTAIAKLQSMMKSASERAGENVVTLTTIHSSKGLEWDRVYMCDLLEGVFPNRDIVRRAKEDDIGDLEEERRLFYVAMTRAKHELKLITVNGVSPSLFVKEAEAILYPERNQKKKVLSGKRTAFNRTPYKSELSGADITEISVSVSRIIGQLEAGVAVRHKIFGEGTVTEIAGGKVSVDFGGSARQFRLEYAIRQGLLTVDT